MKNRILTFLLILAGTWLIIACKSEIGQLTQVTKTIYFPGIEQAKPYIHYNAEIFLKKPIILNQINIKNHEKICIENYKLFSLKNHKRLSIGTVIPKGNYRLLFILPISEKLTNSLDTLAIRFQLPDSEKIYTIIKKVKTTEPEMMP